MGSIFNTGESPSISFGIASMVVNFESGSLQGGVTFPTDIINFSADSVGTYSAGFTGSSVLNGSGAGTMRGQFFGDIASEAYGLFNASTGDRHATGVFGVRTDQIPEAQ